MIEQATLERVPFFGSLNARARRELALRAVLRSFAPEETLWQAGMEAHSLFVVLEGEVRVVRVSKGRQYVIHTEGPGGTLGDVPLFEGATYPATAIAARRTLCIAVSRDAIWSAIKEDPELAFTLLSRLAGRVRHLVDRLDGLVAHNVGARLAAFLLARHQASRSGIITLGGTQLAVAEELGTVREVVVRLLRELREAGVIRSLERGRYELLDQAELRRRANLFVRIASSENPGRGRPE